MINKNSLFSLFNSDNHELSEEENSINIEIDKEYLKIQIFCKLISNRKNLTKSLSSLIDQSVISNISSEDLSDGWMYIRAFGYIKELNTEKLPEVLLNKKIDLKLFIKSLQSSIKYFEEKEIYENCLILFNIEKEIREIRKNLEI